MKKEKLKEEQVAMRKDLDHALAITTKRVLDVGLRTMVEYHFRKIVDLCESQFPREAEKGDKAEKNLDDEDPSYKLTTYDYDVIKDIWVTTVVESFMCNPLLRQIMMKDDIEDYQRVLAHKAMVEYEEDDPISLPAGALLRRLKPRGALGL